MKDDDNDTPYKGPNNRRENRRKKTDRRVDIRFEPDKDDRRKKNGRRKEDRNPWSDHSL